MPGAFWVFCVLSKEFEMATLGGVFGRLLNSQNLFTLPNFDCVVQYAWIKFGLNGGEEDMDMSIIEAVVRNYLSKKPEPTPAMVLRVKFLLFLTRLVDGERHYLFQYDPSPDAATYSSTVLESALRIFDQLVQASPEKKKRAATLRLKILQQAIFVCCRQDNFALAKNVLEFAELEVNVDEVVWEELKLVVESEDAGHPALIENSYKQFCKMMSEELEFVVASLNLKECGQSCIVHMRSVCSEGQLEESFDKFDEEMLKKLLHMSIDSWLPKEHRTVLEKEFLRSEYLNVNDLRSAAHSVNGALCQLNLIKELPVDHNKLSYVTGK